MFKTIIPLRRMEAPVIKPITTWPEVKVRLAERLGEMLGDRLGENEWKILEILWQNPIATIPELAEKIRVSKTAIENNLAKLKKKQFFGACRVGKRRVLED